MADPDAIDRAKELITELRRTLNSYNTGIQDADEARVRIERLENVTARLRFKLVKLVKESSDKDTRDTAQHFAGELEAQAGIAKNEIANAFGLRVPQRPTPQPPPAGFAGSPIIPPDVTSDIEALDHKKSGLVQSLLDKTTQKNQRAAIKALKVDIDDLLGVEKARALRDAVKNRSRGMTLDTAQEQLTGARDDIIKVIENYRAIDPKDTRWQAKLNKIQAHVDEARLASARLTVAKGESAYLQEIEGREVSRQERAATRRPARPLSETLEFFADDVRQSFRPGLLSRSSAWVNRRIPKVAKAIGSELGEETKSRAIPFLWRLQAKRIRRLQRSAVVNQRIATSDFWRFWYALTEPARTVALLGLGFGIFFVPFGIFFLGGWTILSTAAFFLNVGYFIITSFWNVVGFVLVSIINLVGNSMSAILNGIGVFFVETLLAPVGQKYSPYIFTLAVEAPKATPLIDPRVFLPDVFNANSVGSVIAGFLGWLDVAELLKTGPNQRFVDLLSPSYNGVADVTTLKFVGGTA